MIENKIMSSSSSSSAIGRLIIAASSSSSPSSLLSSLSSSSVSVSSSVSSSLSSSSSSLFLRSKRIGNMNNNMYQFRSVMTMTTPTKKNRSSSSSMKVALKKSQEQQQRQQRYYNNNNASLSSLTLLPYSYSHHLHHHHHYQHHRQHQYNYNNHFFFRNFSSGRRGDSKKTEPFLVPNPVDDRDIIDRMPEDAIYPQNLPIDKEYELKQFFLKRWKGNIPGLRKYPLKVSYRDDESEFLEDLSTEFRWINNRHKRCGAIGIKIGMMPFWDEWGNYHPTTILFLDNNVVLDVKTTSKNGYNAIVLGAGEYKKKNVKKTLLGIYKKYGVHDHPPYIVREFRISDLVDEGLYGDDDDDDLVVKFAPEPGSRIHARHFLAGQQIDVSGISKGKGFQGPMKRHNFSGMPASHGTSKSHRHHGSTGQCQDPGKVFKGKKMAGRMGCDRVTVQNLRIFKIDRGRNLLYVKGCIPGNKGSFVEIRDAIKKPLFGTDLVEGGVDKSAIPPLPTYEYDDEIDGSGKIGYEILKPNSKLDPYEPLDDEPAVA